MPHSFPSIWPEEQYNFPEWGDYPCHHPVLRFQEEQKFPPPSEIMDFDNTQLTAVGKPISFAEDLFTKREDSKPMKQWSHHEVMDWLCEEAQKSEYGYERIQLRNFQGIDGCTLLKMTEHDFLEKDEYYGSFLYLTVRNEEAHQRVAKENNLPSYPSIRQPSDDPIYTDLSEPCNLGNLVPSDNDSCQSVSPSHGMPDIKPVDIKTPGPTFKRPVGRPPKPTRPKRGNKEKKCGRLWEFIRDLLLKPEYCPSLICWENHEEGIFRFVRSDKVAELWGTIKDNPKMTYEKLSRAMRYYYKSQVLQPVLGRRLVYKFGPTARGWRTDNPNFRDSTK